uniref:APCDD1 domain-containing protein n=1 Tax=Romanomermis culicivorax TaxID=13658 RepID=A0A915JKL7_ROMCU
MKFLGFVSLLNLVSIFGSKSFLVERRTNVKEKCGAEYANLIKENTKIITPVDLEGHWVSEKCEIHNRLQYILRDYQLDKSGIFQFHHYYYFDEFCAQPSQAFTVTGQISGFSPSLDVVGSQQIQYTVSRVTLVSFDQLQTQKIAETMRKCTNIDDENFGELRELNIFQRKESDKKNNLVYFAAKEEENRDLEYYNDDQTDDFVEKSLSMENDVIKNETISYQQLENLDDDDGRKLQNFDCLSNLNFTTTSLKLMRLEERLIRDSDGSDSRNNYQFESLVAQVRLFLGRPLWKETSNSFELPTSFEQYPLLDVNQVRNCRICEKIRDANQLNPPVLKRQLMQVRRRRSRKSSKSHQLISEPDFDWLSDLKGDWLSENCESYPNGIFGYRMLSYKVNNNRKKNKFKLKKFFFHDPLCRSESFTVMARGHFFELDHRINFSPSHIRPISYKIDRLHVQPKSRSFLYRIRKTGTYCSKLKWRLNSSLDLSDHRSSSSVINDCAVEMGLISRESHSRDFLKILKPDDASSSSSPSLLTADFSGVENRGRSSTTSSFSNFMPPLRKCARFTVSLMVQTLTHDDKTTVRGTPGDVDEVGEKITVATSSNNNASKGITFTVVFMECFLHKRDIKNSWATTSEKCLHKISICYTKSLDHSRDKPNLRSTSGSICDLMAYGKSFIERMTQVIPEGRLYSPFPTERNGMQSTKHSSGGYRR